MWIKISILVFLISLILKKELKLIYLRLMKEDVDIIIGILSNPIHFEKRAIARETWLSYLDDSKLNHFKIKPYFIIGKNICNLTSPFKTNDYGCDEIKLKESSDQQSNFVVNKLIKSTQFNSNKIYKGFLFEINFDISINRLGVLNLALKEQEHFKFYLEDLSNDVSF